MNNRLIIVPKVYYVANFFHFVSNLTKWHYSCRSEYIKTWLYETGPFTKNEKISLTKAKDLFKKYTFGDKFWGLVLLSGNDDVVWEKAKIFFEEKDFDTFLNIYKAFTPRFEKIWQQDRKYLESWSEKLNDYQINLSPTGIIKDLDILFGPKDQTTNKIEVMLLLSSQNFCGGGGNLATGKITLEISRYPLNQPRPAILTMWHEIVHNVWQKKEYKEMLNNFIQKNKKTELQSLIKKYPLYVIINEAITESLFPCGLLAEKYFNFPINDYFKTNLPIAKTKWDKMRYWRIYSAYNLIPLVEKYIKDSKKIDQNFLETILDLYMSFLCYP